MALGRVAFTVGTAVAEVAGIEAAGVAGASGWDAGTDLSPLDRTSTASAKPRIAKVAAMRRIPTAVQAPVMPNDNMPGLEVVEMAALERRAARSISGHRSCPSGTANWARSVNRAGVRYWFIGWVVMTLFSTSSSLPAHGRIEQLLQPCSGVVEVTLDGAPRATSPLDHLGLGQLKEVPHDDRASL